MSHAEPSHRAPSPAPRDVAIVGVACVMPGAPDLEAFWANIVDGVDSVTEVPPSRWSAALHFDRDFEPARKPPGGFEMSVSKWGGFLPEVGFDALRWGIPPASLASIEPSQLLALKVADDALHDAGYGQGEGQRSFDRSRASVLYATGSGGASDLPAAYILRYLARYHHVDRLPAELDAHLPQVTEDTLPGTLTSVIAGRVANRLDLGGKNLTIDSACASVLAALDIACADLAGGSSDLVLCGGVDFRNGAQDYLSFTAAGALSRSGRCRSFDADADGMTLAEGVGCLVLKRLADAERDGDRVYAVVTAVAGSSDGRHLGLTAPRQEGQVEAVRRAYAAADVSPAEIGLVEAHGTGTATGDRTELASTTRVFADGGATPASIVIGSVKSNIGHIKCAAGIASLIKVAKALHHGVLPPTLHVTRPNEVWDPAASPFVFLDQALPWLDQRRAAGVSSFGFGGTNFHAVLGGHGGARPQEAASGRPHWPAELFAVRARSDGELAARLDGLRARLAEELSEPRQADRWRLRDVAAAVSAGEGPVRLAVVARDLDDLAAKLEAAGDRRPMAGVHHRPAVTLAPGEADAPPGAEAGGDTGAPAGTGGSEGSGGSGRPAVAFLLPDAGAARVGMAADLLVAFPALRDVARLAGPCLAAMLPPQAFGDDRARQEATVVAAARPTVAVASLTAARALASLGIAPDRVAGGDNPLVATPRHRSALREALRRTAAARTDAIAVLPYLPGLSPDEASSHRATDPQGVAAEVRALWEDGVRVFVEVGPGQALTAEVERTLAGAPHLAVATDQPGEHGLHALLDAVARMAVAGVPVDLAALHTGRGSRPERWDDPPKPAAWIVNGHRARAATGASLPKGLRPATETPAIHLGMGKEPAAPNGVSTPRTSPVDDQVTHDMALLTEYLRMVHGIAATSSRLLRGGLDGGPAAVGTGAPEPGPGVG